MSSGSIHKADEVLRAHDSQNSFAEEDEVGESTETDQLLQQDQPSSNARRDRSRTVDDSVEVEEQPQKIGGELRRSGSDSNLLEIQKAAKPLSAMRKLSKSRNVDLPAIELPPPGGLGSEDHDVQRSTVVSATPVPQSSSPLARAMIRTSDCAVTHSASGDVKQAPQAPRQQARSTRTGNSTKSVKANSKTSPQKAKATLKIKVFFCDGTSEDFGVAGGRTIESQELLRLMAIRLSTDFDIFNEACSLWLISTKLEVQLKPYHVPFEVFTKWNSILRRFTYLNPAEIAYDVPKLVCKRSAGLSLEREREITQHYENIAHIMYVDAKDEYNNARYIINSTEEALTLAALQLAIHREDERFTTRDRKGKLKNQSTLEWISTNVSKCCPKYRLNSMKSYYLFGFNLLSCVGMHQELVNEFEKWFAQKEQGNHFLKLRYLEILRKTPFYGAAYFDAQIELRADCASLLTNPRRRLFTKNGDDAMDVKVSISRQYITVIDMNRHEVILCQQISDCTWKYMLCIDEEAKKTAKSMDMVPQAPCILLHFPEKVDLRTIVDAKEADDEKAADMMPTSCLLQLFGRQSEMMVALLTAQHDRNISDAMEMYEAEQMKLRKKREEKQLKRDLRRRKAKKLPMLPEEDATDSARPEEDDEDTGYSSEQDLKEDCERLEQFVKDKLEPKRETYDCVFDGYNLDRYCYATFDPAGRMLQAEGSLKIGYYYQLRARAKKIADAEKRMQEAEAAEKARLAAEQQALDGVSG